MKNVQDVVVRIAHEFNNTQSIQDKDQPGGYVGLDENGKIPLDKLNLEAINSPQAQILNLHNNDLLYTGKEFQLLFDVKDYSEHDSIMINNTHHHSIVEDDILTVSGTINDPGEFDVCVTRFGNVYPTEFKVKVTDVEWVDFRSSETFPYIVNHSGMVTYTNDGVSFTKSNKTVMNEVLFTTLNWKRSDNVNIEVIIDFKENSPLFYFGLVPVNINVDFPKLLNKTELMVSSRYLLYGNVTRNRMDFSLNNINGKYRISFVDSGNTINVYKVDDSEFSWSKGELVYTQDIQFSQTTEDLMFSIMAPEGTGDTRITAYREF